MLQGAAIAFLLILIFLFGNDYSDPAWGKFWMVRPMIIVPIAGAIGGVLYYFLDDLRSQGGWKKILAIIMSLLGYIIILWFGTVLGLDGTMWN
jgi:ABC-type transport system involved in cytochrome c biogenesis permease subunit